MTVATFREPHGSAVGFHPGTVAFTLRRHLMEA